MNVFDLFAKLSLDSADYDKGLESAGKKAAGFGDKLKIAFAVGGAAIAAVTTASGAMAAAVGKGAGEVASYGDNIDKMSQKMGISAEAFQEWDAIMQHSGTSIEALKPSMKTLANAAEKNSDAFQKLGISQEEVASMNQEQLFARTISALQNMEEGTERTYLTSKLLGRGATELGALLNTSAEDTEKMRQRVHELGGVMSNEAVKAAAAYQDSLQDLGTSVDGLKRKAFSEFLPALTTVMDGMTNLFSGDVQAGIGQIAEGVSKGLENLEKIIPRVFEIGGGIVEGLAKAFEQNFPSIVSAGTKIISQLITGAVEHIPDVIKLGAEVIQAVVSSFAESAPALIQTGIAVINTISSGLAEGIPALLENALPMLVEFSGALREGAGQLVDAGLEMLVNLAKGIADGLPALIENIPQIVTNIANIINDNAPKILAAGVEIILTLVVGIIKSIPTLIANIPKIVEAIFSVIMAVNWVNLGASIVSGLGNGIASFAGNVVDTVKGFISEIEYAIKWPIGAAQKWGVHLIENFGFGLISKVKWLLDTVKGVAQGIKNFLGFSEPKEGPLSDFHTYAPDMMQLFAKGIKDNEGIVRRQIAQSFDFGGVADVDMGYDEFTVPVSGGGGGGRMLNVILELDHMQLGKAVYRLNNEETQRVGVRLAGGVV